MARRRIGQEDRLARSEPRAARSLSQLAGLIDWVEIDRHLVGIPAGEAEALYYAAQDKLLLAA